MTGKIYLMQRNETLQPLEEERYPSEDRLQTLLEKQPELLAGDQINPSAPRRWLLVSREVGVPGEEGSGNLWSLDLLLLDQDAIPTLVEVKRSSDPRIRREVVGQMLDYAANAVAYWPVETFRATFEATCQKRGVEVPVLLGELKGLEPLDSTAIDAFWGQVKANLRAG